MERLNEAEPVPKPVAVILENRTRLAEKLGVKEVHHTPPAMPHYPHLYPWDSASAIEILSHFGYLREAETEAFAIFNKQGADGKVANIQRVKGFRNLDPELLTFTEPGQSADYSQPPVWGRTIASLYYAKKARDPYQALLLLDGILPRVVSSLDYFANHRRIAQGNPLIFNTLAQETGRDSDEALNGYMPKLPSNGMGTPYLVELINTGADYVGKLALGGLNRIYGWDPQKIKRYYAPVDPMFNAIYADNLRQVSGLARELEENAIADRLQNEADSVEERLCTDLFVPEANQGKGAFLVYNKGHKDEISITGTGPLLLESLPEHMLESILDMADDHLDAPYPWPTLSVKSRHYDPEGRRPHRVWDGEVMMIANWLGVLGLRKQAVRAREKFGRPDLAARCLGWSEKRLIPRSKQLLRQGYYEGFSSQTGRPRRAGTVKGNFVWDGLIETL